MPSGNIHHGKICREGYLVSNKRNNTRGKEKYNTTRANVKGSFLVLSVHDKDGGIAGCTYIRNGALGYISVR